jgi:hypothetical protein
LKKTLILNRSFGCVVYEMIELKRLFQEPNSLVLRENIKSEEYRLEMPVNMDIEFKIVLNK